MKLTPIDNVREMGVNTTSWSRKKSPKYSCVQIQAGRWRTWWLHSFTNANELVFLIWLVINRSHPLRENSLNYWQARKIRPSHLNLPLKREDNGQKRKAYTWRRGWVADWRFSGASSKAVSEGDWWKTKHYLAYLTWPMAGGFGAANVACFGPL